MIWEAQYDPASPAGSFAALVDAWRKPENKVFVLRNTAKVPNVRDFFDAHFGELGTPAPFAEDVTIGDREHQRTDQIWMEVRFDPNLQDAYRHSSNAQPLHTDGAYVAGFPNATLMACVTNAAEGGETTFVAGKDVVACLRAENPDLLEKLSAKPILHSRSGDERLEKIIDLDGEDIQLNWNYYCLSRDLSAEDRATVEAFHAFLRDSDGIARCTKPVKLEHGDAVTWKDRDLLHGRNGFHATATSERFLWKCAIDIGEFH